MGKLSESNVHRLAAWSSKFFAYHYNIQNPSQSHKVCSNITKLTSEQHFPTIDKFKKQVQKNIEAGIIKPIKTEQLLINIVALNIFPFIAAPLLKGFLSINNEDYKQLVEDRKTEVSAFIINSIKV